MSQVTGKVRWFNPSKGFGFLGRESGPDVFVHYTALPNGDFTSLREGEAVSFEITQGVQGPQAAQVHRLERKASTGMLGGAPGRAAM